MKASFMFGSVFAHHRLSLEGNQISMRKLFREKGFLSLLHLHPMEVIVDTPQAIIMIGEIWLLPPLTVIRIDC